MCIASWLHTDRRSSVTCKRSKRPVPAKGITLILLAFLGLGTLYSVTVPLFEAPDEDGHYTYVQYMARGRGLPVICLEGGDCPEVHPPHPGSTTTEAVSPYVINHPPLYYGLAGLATSWLEMEPPRDAVQYNPHFDYGVRGLRGNKNAVIHTQAEAFPYRATSLAVHIGRWVSLLLGGGAVWATYLLALELFPDQRWLVLGTTAITAFNPQFLFISARLGNDAAVAAFCSLALWATVRFLNQEQPATGPARYWNPLSIGCFLGLALLSKVNAVGLLPIVALAILLKAVRQRSLRSFILWSGAIFGVCMAIAGWWYVRNGVLYGDPLLWKVHLELVPSRDPTPSLRELYRHEFGSLEASFWAVFGWMNIPVHEWIYHILRIVTRFAALGLLLRVGGQVIRWFRSPKRPGDATPAADAATQSQEMGAGKPLATSRSSSSDVGLGITALWLIILFLSLLLFMRVQPGAQGRYLFPGISAISLLLLLGLSQWVPPRWGQPRIRLFLSGVVAGGLFLLAVLCPFVYIAPAYAHPSILSPDQVPEGLNRLEVSFGDRVVLLGAELGQQVLHPGEKAEVTLCWESKAQMDVDYSVFLHLLGRNSSSGRSEHTERVGQLDIYPGVGSYPTTLWRVGDIICDDYQVPISPEATAPVAAQVQAGLYQRDSLERLPAFDSTGRPLGQVVVGRVKVIPRQWPQYEMETPVLFTLGERFTLRGYDLVALDESTGDKPQQLQPGTAERAVRLTLYWEALLEDAQDYTVFIHLLGPEGQIWDQADAQPMSGAYPTSFWGQGELLQDGYVLSLPPDAPPGTYEIEMGMYVLATGERLPVQDAEGVRVEGDRIRLGSLEFEDAEGKR
jgi:hypothetical protein